MIRVVMFEYDDTLVHDDRPRPHVVEMFARLAHLAESGTSPQTIIVADSEIPAHPSPIANRAALNTFTRRLDRCGLAKFVTPASQRVTLACHAGVALPDRRVYATARRRLGGRVAAAECLVVGGRADHIAAARGFGYHGCHFGTDITDWIDLPGKLNPSEEELFTASLADAGQLAPPGAPLAPGQTHTTVVDDDGREHVVRGRFSAI